MFDPDEYLRETREFMLKTADPNATVLADLALDRMKYALLTFGGMGKPQEQEVDVATMTIRLTWRRGTRTTTVEVSDRPGYILEWTHEQVKQRMVITFHGGLSAEISPVEA